MNIQKIISELIAEKKKLSQEIANATDIQKRMVLFGMFFAITKELKNLKLQKLRNKLNYHEPSDKIKKEKGPGLIGNSILLYLADNNHAFLALGLYALNSNDLEIFIAYGFAEQTNILNKKKNT